MDIFEYELDKEKFRETNAIWNEMELNSTESVGVVSELINQKQFKTKEEWVEYYYEKGRTKQQLMEVAQKLHDAVGDDYSIDECFYITEYRVIKETWNGIIIRETKTIDTLQAQFPDVVFKKTKGEFDYKYAVDYEVFFNDELIGGIQIKPESYKGNSNYVLKAKRANAQKNKQYFIDFNRQVYTIISSMNGSIFPNDDFVSLMRKIFLTENQ